MKGDKHYEIKKIIASLMALSIIGASSLTFGGTAKAATLNSTSSVSMIATNSYRTNLDADINSRGDVFWTRTSGARLNEIRVTKVSGKEIVAFGGGADYLSLNLYQYVKDVGNYLVDVRALDEKSRILAYDKFYFYL
ncbi:hypothetical protein [Clostridium drakei]|uniref:Uncharacterized protein n=1 Tax=Clostridium drakei TaxID=332101 RepID=A0A2U8DNQ5_9CLOT|nr:hypothetical protein [Clostridium drakei]AWI04075.1 hypothetical protein B9W14_06060 [Clostridium drakei]